MLYEMTDGRHMNCMLSASDGFPLCERAQMTRANASYTTACPPVQPTVVLGVSGPDRRDPLDAQASTAPW